jgi:hypothetical protein
MEMKEFSKEWWRTIPCDTGCANCCPKTCAHLTADKLCDVHPSLFDGSDKEAEKHDRGLGCHADPITIFTYHVYCPPIVRILEANGIPEIKHYSTAKGFEMLSDPQKVYAETDEIRGFRRGK